MTTTSCASGQYWTGTQCAACSANCTSCAALTGACSTCASPFVLSAGKCVCPSGKIFDGTTRVDLNICVAGKYNDGANNCLDCGSNCVSCENVTGKCLTCADTFKIDQSNPKNCTNCVYPIGPVDAPVSCVGTAFSATRVIPPYQTTATEVDWRKWGIVNPIQDQGQCGSCWAFSTIGNTEINYAIATGKLYKYSEQHVNSCDTGNYGCGGGWPSVALSFIANTGTYLGAAYPYISGRTGVTEVCKTLVDPKQKPLKAPGYI